MKVLYNNSYLKGHQLRKTKLKSTLKWTVIAGPWKWAVWANSKIEYYITTLKVGTYDGTSPIMRADLDDYLLQQKFHLINLIS